MASVRNFVVVGANKSILVQVLLAVHTFTDAKCTVVCPKGTRFLRLSNLCSACVEADFDGEDDDRFIDAVNRIAETAPDLMLIPSDCDGARMTDRVRRRLRATTIPAPDAAMLDRFDNKWRFYQFCKEHGLNVPPTRLVGSKHELQFASVAGELGLPFVLKPVNQEASRGVQIISCERDYQTILKNDNYQYAPLIAQRYIAGTDVGLNLLAIQGRVAAIAIQQRNYPQHEAAKIKFFSNKYLESVAHTLAGKSGYHGVMNIDARIEEGTGKIFLFESNPRFWRSLSASVWCGLNFVAESIEASRRPNKVRMLTAESADTYYHPLFRPSLWLHAVFGRNCHRGRMVRLMMSDMCTLAAQAKGLLRVRSDIPSSST